MKIRSIKVTPRFEKSFSKLPVEIQKATIIKKKAFVRDPFAPDLKTHKLSGKLKGLWSFSVSYSYRILLEFDRDDRVLFHDIGDHRVYR
ncbi:MAG: type II toxin-antitoxin system mRNA interferase toxin, RelE/StbE family [Candidatus Berkelbacteria bacterium]|nr:type II toxin-antitoxin system mRNA interferase toxin, RelE/StbE family [Candidatus Berkelbacteria bacterium]